MPKSTVCKVSGRLMGIDEVIAAGEKRCACVECGRPVRPHRASTFGEQGAHFEHTTQNLIVVLATLFPDKLSDEPRLPLARYIGHRRRGRIQQRADDALEFFLGDFDGFSHVPIIRQRGFLLAFSGVWVHNQAWR